MLDCRLWTGWKVLSPNLIVKRTGAARKPLKTNKSAPGNLFSIPNVWCLTQVLAKLVARSWLSPLWLVLTPSRRHLANLPVIAIKLYLRDVHKTSCIYSVFNVLWGNSSAQYSVRPQCLMLLCGFISIILQNTHWQQHHRICTPTL